MTLHQPGCGNDKNVIAAALTATFEEERYIEDDNRFSAGAGKSEKFFFARSNHRVNDPLQPGESLRVGEDTRPEKRPIDPAIDCANAWKCCCYPPHRRAARRQQPVNHTIGVEERNPEPAQRLRRGALAHADRTGQTKNDHGTGAKVATIAARSSWVTRTGAPNQASNPGRP